MKKLDLKTLEHVKQRFDFLSDMSTKCQGYSMLCRLIEETKKENEKPKTYEEKLKLYERVKRTMESDLTWKEKYDIIFSEHISEKLDFPYCNSDGGYDDDVKDYYRGFTEYIERERIIHEQIDQA
jgi:hypothetical protein